MSIKYSYWLLALPILALAGCARYPTSDQVPPDVPPRTIYSEITVAGLINPNYFYFLALNTDSTHEGPVPVTTGTGFGNGWGTISSTPPQGPVRQPPYFVEYHNGFFQQFRVNPLTGIAESQGQPYRAQILAADHTPAGNGPILAVEVDTRQIVPPGVLQPDFVELNWITMERIALQPQEVGINQQYDGFDASGNNFFEVTLGSTNTWISGVGSVPNEPSNDTTNLHDIDLIGWRIEVRIH